MSEATAPVKVQPTRGQVRQAVAAAKTQFKKEGPKILKSFAKALQERCVADTLAELDKQLNPPPPPAPKIKERVNGNAAAIVLLRLYEKRDEDRESQFDCIPISEFVDRLTKTDSRALPTFWMVLHDFLCIVSDGCVPNADAYVSLLNIAPEDERKVRDQLGYLNPKPTKKKGASNAATE